MKKKVLFVDTAHPVLRQELEKMGFQCDFFPTYSRNEFEKIVGDYTGIIIRSKIKLDSHFLSHAAKLRFIGRVGAGMENIDTVFAAQKGIVCLNAPEGNRDAVGEQAVGMLLALFNNLIKADAEVRKGIWLREENRGLEIGGKTIGILGYGNTGSSFARKLRGFDVHILAYDKYKTGFGNAFVTEVSLETLFEKAEIISLHVPLTEETRYMVNTGFFRRFKHPIYLINTSRGKVVDTAALVQALETGKVRGACLDVLEYEGLSFENLEKESLPEPFQKLTTMQNVLLSPHIAGWTHQSLYKLGAVLAEKVSAFLNEAE